jgi:hypothetical protein
MKGLIEFLRKLGRLFVDDGSMAIALFAWCVVAGLIFPAFAVQSLWSAPLFSAGCLIILFASVFRAVEHHIKH